MTPLMKAHEERNLLWLDRVELELSDHGDLSPLFIRISHEGSKLEPQEEAMLLSALLLRANHADDRSLVMKIQDAMTQPGSKAEAFDRVAGLLGMVTEKKVDQLQEEKDARKKLANSVGLMTELTRARYNKLYWELVEFSVYGKYPVQDLLEMLEDRHKWMIEKGFV